MPSYPAGTPDRIPHWVRLLDHVLALTIACPLVSLLWCGGFFLTDTYIYPNDKPFGYWLIFIVGSMLSLNVHIHCDSLIAISARCPDSAQLLQRLIGIVLIVTIVFQWDGLWCLLDYYLGHTQISCFYCWALGTVVLCLTGCRNNMVTGVPFMCRHDRAELLFAATTRFHAKSYGSRLWSFCDQLFSIFVVQPSVILIWRGLWNIQDYTLLPKDPVKSANISCLAGTLVTIVLYLLQDSVAEITLALRPCARFGVELVWQQLAVASSVTLWRGQWVWFALIFEELASMWFVTLAAGWILTILNMGGLSTQLGAVPDPPLDIRTDVIRFPIDYVAQIYKTHVQYTALIKQQQQPGQRLSTSPLSKPLLKTNRATAKALYPLLDEIQLPLPDSLPS
ncbi:uncharacterized protein LOC111260991 isoform X3 [Varroa jacobsoni]|uniref:uncharacterized protein LOC111260991 isoform X3 n=1 Tax=Varroa jacobsoni TaxID=62625 RepID=UPI000BFA0AC7|nr:uncharacterized protein LOC111260991 isoform X3 [Varroa jacobsoni]